MHAIHARLFLDRWQINPHVGVEHRKVELQVFDVGVRLPLANLAAAIEFGHVELVNEVVLDGVACRGRGRVVGRGGCETVGAAVDAENHGFLERPAGEVLAELCVAGNLTTVIETSVRVD